MNHKEHPFGSFKHGGKRTPGKGKKIGRPKKAIQGKKTHVYIDPEFLKYWQAIPKLKRSYFLNEALRYFKQRRPDLFKALIEPDSKDVEPIEISEPDLKLNPIKTSHEPKEID